MFEVLKLVVVDREYLSSLVVAAQKAGLPSEAGHVKLDSCHKEFLVNKLPGYPFMG